MSTARVRNVLLVILGIVLVIFLSPLAVNVHRDSLRTCESDSDCGIVPTSCSTWDTINKKHIRRYPVFGCLKNTSDSRPPIPACIRKRCAAKGFVPYPATALQRFERKGSSHVF